MDRYVFWTAPGRKIHITNKVKWMPLSYRAECKTYCNRNLTGYARNARTAGTAPGGGHITCQRCRARLLRELAILQRLATPGNTKGAP